MPLGAIYADVPMVHLSKKICLLIALFFVISFLTIQPVLSLTEEDCKQRQGEDINDGIACWESLLGEVGERKTTLRSEIARFNTSIALTTARISQTIVQIRELEKEIASLGGKIVKLDISLDQASEILIKRVAETYKKGKIDPLALLLSSKDFTEFVSRYKYLRVMQLYDRKLMIQMETVRTNYEDQRTAKEEKQEELEIAQKKLESQKILLAQQKADRERLLEITRNNEKRFQDLLSKARAELIAIKGILAGKGREAEIRSVSEGEKIASMIPGVSCNSSGTHLHFMASQGSDTHNPFSYLKGGIAYENCSGSSCGNPDGDSFNPSGSWSWPLNPSIKFNQGYGYTWAIQHTWVGRIYDFHNGIDIVSDSLDVKAVKAGILYQGVYEGDYCNLSYVRVNHDDSDLDTLYLHVYY